MKLKQFLTGACLLAAGMTGAVAQHLPKTHVRVVGSISTLPQYKDFEQPFWTKELAERSGGAVTGEIRGFNEMGLKGPEVLRMTGMGSMEFAATALFYLAADDPTNEMIDIAGLLPDVQSARKATEASKPVYEKLYREKFGVELLGIGTYPGQVIYCNAELKGLADVKGKKVRVAGRSQSEFIEALGGTPVTMAFGEVVPAMQNKTVDCAVTGTLSGNLAKWHEVATHMIAAPVSWGQIVYAVNAKSWARMDPKVREFISQEVRRLEKNVWDAADQFTEQGYACNAGRPDCKLGVPGKMTLVPLSKADREQLRKVVSDVMLPKWAARCSAQCVSDFNATVGKTLGVTAAK
ncbi:TRAP transporter substrate-binding protein [Schlegelella sp. S2-27]|uniref:TRAP transporter substrate-binding protein n=1 Tax=Caldimonas mangrovi TaxID=2944811 RepID=A0ABT0YWD1_9BURK|nr:TRAP transporter substrate-binding protein [Caldimonas mangrovi]MCM5682652.1 TRAP transporter substrate-binding protein [Caldimonas mangrovi]